MKFFSQLTKHSQDRRKIAQWPLQIYNNYNPTEDENDGAVRWVANAINGAIMTHPNRPTIRFFFGTIA